MPNFERYNKLHNEIMRRLEDGEITTEQAKEINDLAFEKYITEKVETNLLDKTIAKTMTLYHGSDKNLDTIKPMSINMGTRLSKMRISSFWANNQSDCILWACNTFFFEYAQLPYRLSFKNKKVYTIDTEYAHETNPNKFRHVSEWLKDIYKDHPLYLYTLTNIQVKQVGRGQINIDEYTLDKEVKPSNKKQLTWGDISQYIEYVSKEKFASLPPEAHGRKGKDASFIEKVIFRDGSKTMAKRNKIYDKAIKQYKDKMEKDPKTLDELIEFMKNNKIV